MSDSTPQTPTTIETTAQNATKANPFLGSIPTVRRRRPGRPRQRVITPEKIEQIAALWLRGAGPESIAKQLQVTPNTIRHHVKHSILPMLENSVQSTAIIELAKLNAVEAEAWAAYQAGEPIENETKKTEVLTKNGRRAKLSTVSKRHKGQQSGWLDVITRCISERCRIMGHFAPAEVKLSGGIRIAGADISEMGETMMARLAEKIEQRRAYEAQVRAFASDN